MDHDHKPGRASAPVAAAPLAVAGLAAAWLAAPTGLAAQEGSGAEAATAEPTTVVVRVVAHDAKVIGSGVGGARVTIRDASSGEVLARGVQEGSTGSTDRIMRQPHGRGDTIYGTPEAAAFTATLDLERPTRVEITGEGPLGTPHAMQSTTKTLLLVPGRDVGGEGVILELHGFTVELQAPAADAPLTADDRITVRARVQMLCGCPLTPGGMWDAQEVDIRARLLRDGTVVGETPLTYGAPSIFAGRLRPPGPGTYELAVVAADAERANFGETRRTLEVGPAED